jgi:succinate dehydrogenase / fumarate reductase, iron-sulfur subunit
MEKYQFSVFRFDPEKDKTHKFDNYEVPYRMGMTVLDGLNYIRNKLDGSLAFRASCREGVCGSCGMHINGIYRLSCETQLKLLNTNKITVRPLSHLPVIRDLFVDMDPFWEKYEYMKPYLMPGDAVSPERERFQTADDRMKLNGLVECILCLCCHASCTVTMTDPNYIGPAALLKADRFFQDSRDKAYNERLDLVEGDDGIWRCHTIYNCQKVCPKSLDPTASIAHLKQQAIARKLKVPFLFKHK